LRGGAIVVIVSSDNRVT